MRCSSARSSRRTTAPCCGTATWAATAAAWAPAHDTSWACPWQRIEDDYLATNLYTDEPTTLRADANLRFIRVAVEALTSQWGGIGGYVRDALGVSDADVSELRARYLE